MWRLVPVLVAEMGQAFSELVRAEALITEVLKLEETRFQGTLERGLRLLEEATADLPAGGELPGETAFQLYDTYGFPLDLTQDALRARGMTVDVAGFDQAMERQRAEARASWKGSGDQAEERIWFELREVIGATEFLGYDHESAEAQVKALVVGGAPVQRAEPGGEVMVVTNQTPFYGESGGQIGDTGTIRRGPALVRISDTQKKLGDLHVHIGRLEGGRARGRRCRRDGDRWRASGQAAPGAFGDAPAARGAAPPPRLPRHAEGLAGRHPTGCASTSAIRRR